MLSTYSLAEKCPNKTAKRFDYFSKQRFVSYLCLQFLTTLLKGEVYSLVKTTCLYLGLLGNN